MKRRLDILIMFGVLFFLIAALAGCGGGPNSPSTKDDLIDIEAMLSSYVRALNKGAALTEADLEQFYAANFGINNGRDRTQAVSEVVNSFTTSGKSITSMTGLTIDPIAGTGDYMATNIAYFSDGSFGFFPEDGFIAAKEGGTWKFKGNGYWSSAEIMSESIRRVKADGTVQTESGIELWIRDQAIHGLNTAVVSGPGLPPAGITFTQSCEPAQLCIPPASQNNTVLNPSRLYLLDDSTIDTIPDNAVYTVNIYDAGAVLVETRTVILPKRPFKRSELTPGHFLSLIGISSHAISAMNIGGTLTFSIGHPTMFKLAGIAAHLDFRDNTTGNGDSYYDENLLLTSSSVSITSVAPVGWTPTNGLLYLWTNDGYGSDTTLIWEFQ